MPDTSVMALDDPPELDFELEPAPDDEELDELPHALSAITDAIARKPVKADLVCLSKACPPPKRDSC